MNAHHQTVPTMQAIVGTCEFEFKTSRAIQRLARRRLTGRTAHAIKLMSGEDSKVIYTILIRELNNCFPTVLDQYLNQSSVLTTLTEVAQAEST